MKTIDCLQQALKKRLRNLNKNVATGYFPPQMSDVWWETDRDCLGNLTLLSQGAPLELRKGMVPPSSTPAFTPESAADFIARTFRCPINISHPSQEEIRERLLETLMSTFRLRLEAKRHDIDLRNVFMTLSAVSVHALLSGNLRFFDAMNYYHELISWKKGPDGLGDVFVGIYAHALNFYAHDKNWHYR